MLSTDCRFQPEDHALILLPLPMTVTALSIMKVLVQKRNMIGWLVSLDTLGYGACTPQS